MFVKAFEEILNFIWLIICFSLFPNLDFASTKLWNNFSSLKELLQLNEKKNWHSSLVPLLSLFTSHLIRTSKTSYQHKLNIFSFSFGVCKHLQVLEISDYPKLCSQSPIFCLENLLETPPVSERGEGVIWCYKWWGDVFLQQKFQYNQQ